jgi:hypothetical protein
MSYCCRVAARRSEESRTVRHRFGVYLSPQQVDWLKKTRGRFLTELGTDVGTTDLIRAAIDRFRGLDWSELKRAVGEQIQFDFEPPASESPKPRPKRRS